MPVFVSVTTDYADNCAIRPINSKSKKRNSIFWQSVIEWLVFAL